MNAFFYVLSFLLLQGLFAPAVASEISAPSRWIGRVDAENSDFSWPGSGLEIVFSGTALAVELRDTGKNSLVVDVDGQIKRLDLSPGQNTYPIATGLSQGKHKVKLFRRTEGFFGETRFLSARTDGVFLPGEAPKRRLLVVGDSISAGYGVEGETKDCKFSADTENQYLTFGAVAGRAFDAEVTTLAISGAKVSTPAKGSPGLIMPSLIDRNVQARKTTNTAPRSAAFDAVIVNLGTNDFTGGARPTGFIDDYTLLLTNLRRQNPNAVIYASLGPMLMDNDFAAAEAAITDAVQLRQKAGDSAIRFLRFRIKSNGKFGCNWHPHVTTQAAMADILVNALRQDLHWSAP